MQRVRLLILNAALGPLDYKLAEGMQVEPGSVVVAPLGPRAVTGIADCYYFLGQFEQAAQPLQDLLLLPEGAANPYIRLRRGQVFHHLGNDEAAATELTCAYLNGGREVFDGESDCRELIDSIIAGFDS